MLLLLYLACTPEIFLEQYQRAASLEMAGTPAPRLECEPPKAVFHRRVSVFIEGADLDAIVRVSHAFDEHAAIYPGLRKSKLCTRSGDRYRFRYINEAHVRFGIIAVPVRATTFSEHDSLSGAAGENRRWMKSMSTFVDEVPKQLDPDLCAAPLANNSRFLSRIDSLWLFDRKPGGVSVTSDVFTLMKTGLNWFEQKALRDTLSRLTDETLRTFVERFARKSP